MRVWMDACAISMCAAVIGTFRERERERRVTCVYCPRGTLSVTSRKGLCRRDKKDVNLVNKRLSADPEATQDCIRLDRDIKHDVAEGCTRLQKGDKKVII